MLPVLVVKGWGLFTRQEGFSSTISKTLIIIFRKQDFKYNFQGKEYIFQGKEYVVSR